jgi:two-component system sensor histidine kinase PilS (NtrC family)
VAGRARFLAVACCPTAVEVQAGRRELHELGEIHRRIVDSVSSGLLTVSRDGVISSFNREAERITGWPISEALGGRLEQLFPALGPVDSAGRQERMQVRFESRDGRKLHLGMSVSVLRDPGGQADGAIVIFQDLTRVVEMEEELRRSERLGAIGQLAAGLAHEIRNPLASLSGAIELLATDLPSGDQNSKTLSQIVQRETARLNRLVSDFLTYARPTWSLRAGAAAGCSTRSRCSCSGRELRRGAASRCAPGAAGARNLTSCARCSGTWC